MNVALMGSVSSSYHALHALIQGGVEITGVLGLDESLAEVICDFTSLEPLADRAGIAFCSFTEVGEPAVEHFLRTHPPDLLWVIGLSQLIPDRLLRVARHGGVGFHPTLLPRGRGRAPVAWTLLLQERAAVSLFFLCDQPDAGDLIVQREVEVQPDDYSEDLIRRTNNVLATVVRELAPRIRAGTLPRTPQPHEQATYYPKRTRADGLIDWSQPTDLIYRLIRAAGRPYGGAYCFVGGHEWTIWRARPAGRDAVSVRPNEADAGTILNVDREQGVLVRTIDGGLWLTETVLHDTEGNPGDRSVLTVGAKLRRRP